MEKEVKKEVKQPASNEEIINALALDLVQLASQCKLAMSGASFNTTSLQHALLLGNMCEDILNTFVQKEETKEGEDEASNS